MTCFKQFRRRMNILVCRASAADCLPAAGVRSPASARGATRLTSGPPPALSAEMLPAKFSKIAHYRLNASNANSRDQTK